MLKVILIFLMFGAVQAATLDGIIENSDGSLVFNFFDHDGAIACIQPKGDGDPVMCMRPGGVKYICKQEIIEQGFISDCKREEW